jgi:hypothetical protein
MLNDMGDASEDASEETLTARLAYYRKRAAEAEEEAGKAASSDLREAYIALARRLLQLAEKNAQPEGHS